jgi:hypothetical protein
MTAKRNYRRRSELIAEITAFLKTRPMGATTKEVAEAIGQLPRNARSNLYHYRDAGFVASLECTRPGWSIASDLIWFLPENRSTVQAAIDANSAPSSRSSRKDSFSRPSIQTTKPCGSWKVDHPIKRVSIFEAVA